MKSIFWKEWRENRKWAALSFLFIILAEFYMLSSERGGSSDSYNNLTLCSSGFLLVTTFGSCAIGTALGFLQILPELRRDQWAFLLHRPIPRGTIFFGKVTAGLTLYLAVTVTALLAAAGYVATPGQFPAPFVFPMALAAFSDLLLGMLCYSAVLLACLYRGSWWGVRGLVVLSVLLVLMVRNHSFWGPWVWPPVMTILFLVAAHGVMTGNGLLQKNDWICRAALSLILLAGATSLQAILLLGFEYLPKEPNKTPRKYHRFEITKEGEILLAEQTGNGESLVVTDRKGNKVTDERYIGNNRYENLNQLMPLAFGLGSPLGEVGGFYFTMPRSVRNSVEIIERNYSSKELWYLLVKEKYFIGFDKLSRRCVGYFDSEGFKAPGVKVVPFEQPLKSSPFSRESPVLFWLGSQVCGIDFPERELRDIYLAADGIRGAGFFSSGSSKIEKRLTAVALENEVRILGHDGKGLVTIPYRAGLAPKTHLSISTNVAMDRFYLQYESWFGFDSLGNDEKKYPPVFLDVVGASGQVIESYTHEANIWMVSRSQWVKTLGIISSPVLPAWLAGLYATRSASGNLYFFGNYSAITFRVPSEAWAPVIFIALALAVTTFFWSFRIGFSVKGALGWSFFVFCFGLPGLLVYRLVSDWPDFGSTLAGPRMKNSEADALSRDMTEIFDQKL